jgi:methyl-accepting chemotaxis protein
VTFVTYRAFRDLRDIRGVMDSLSSGNLDVAIPHTGLRNELGDMAKAVEVFKVGLIDNRRLVEAEAAEAATKLARARTVEQLTAEFERNTLSLCQSLAAAAAEMEQTAESLGSVARSTNTRSMEVASIAEQTSANVQVVAASTEELTASIEGIAVESGRSSEAARDASRTVEETRDRVARLADIATRIGSVIELINSIAGQTNLLALNATIEAARAGEAGRGFAVVASEVKSLASQTAKATEEITTQITVMQESTNDVVSAIEGIARTIGDLAGIAGQVTSSMDQQRIATQEIARNVHEAAQGTGQVTNTIAGVRSGAGETGAAAEQVLSAARELAQSAEQLRGNVDRYLADVKAA